MASPHKETVGDEYAELVARVCVLRAGKGRLGEQDDAQDHSRRDAVPPSAERSRRRAHTEQRTARASDRRRLVIRVSRMPDHSTKGATSWDTASSHRCPRPARPQSGRRPLNLGSAAPSPQASWGFAQCGMFEPDRVSQEIPEGFFVVSLGHGGGLLTGEGDAAPSPPRQRVTDQVWPTE